MRCVFKVSAICWRPLSSAMSEPTMAAWGRRYYETAKRGRYVSAAVDCELLDCDGDYLTPPDAQYPS